jgi:hypothetical protein
MLYHCEGIRKEKSISSVLLIPSPTGPRGVLPDPTGRLLALARELGGEQPKLMEYHSFAYTAQRRLFHAKELLLFYNFYASYIVHIIK